MGSPAVSVVLPVYNASRYLRLAIQSVLAQTLRDFELIAVDDGSRDDSLAILREFAGHDSRVKVVSRPNTGIVGALNDGIAAAQGELIARMDADDVARPERFARQLSFLNEHPDAVLVGSQVMLIDPDGLPICPKRDTEYTHERIEWAHLNHRWPLVHPSVMMRKSAVLKAGGYRTRYQWLEDLDLFLRLAEVGKLASLPDILLDYRLHPESVCHTREADQDSIRPALYAETYARRGIQNAKDTAPPPTHEARNDDERNKLWAWWAIIGGNARTARKYAFRAMRSAPWATDSWKLMFCALRGR